MRNADTAVCPACGRNVPAGPGITTCVLCGATLPRK